MFGVSKKNITEYIDKVSKDIDDKLLIKDREIATLKPEKTTLFRCTYYKLKNGYKTKHRSNFRIIVIAPDKYDEVMKKLYILRKLGGDDYREYLDKLAGGVRSF